MYHDKPMLVFKQRHHACNMIKGWFHTTNPFIRQHIFEIRQVEYEQLPTNRNIMMINDIDQKTIDDYCPFSQSGIDDYKTVLEDTWKKL